MTEAILSVDGWCDICERKVTFRSDSEWLRDHFLCSGCASIPRERALMQALRWYFPDYRGLAIYEPSPTTRGISQKLARECPGYIASVFDPTFALGKAHPELAYRNENLENLTFPDESFDLVVTQDVMEHVFQPQAAFAEVARILRPGGAHIFTVPLVRRLLPSEQCAARLADGDVVLMTDAEYHGSPLDGNRALVTFRWGYDICELIHRVSGLFTTIVRTEDMAKGLKAEYLEVLVSVKLRLGRAILLLSRSCRQ